MIWAINLHIHCSWWLKSQKSFDSAENAKGQFTWAAWKQMCHIFQHLFLISHKCFPGKHRAVNINNSMLILCFVSPIILIRICLASYTWLMSLRSTPKNCQLNVYWSEDLFFFCLFFLFLPILPLKSPIFKFQPVFSSSLSCYQPKTNAYLRLWFL